MIGGQESLVLYERWKFKKFKEKRLPKMWETGFFQREYLKAKDEKIVANIAQHTKDVPQLAKLEYDLVQTVKVFDEQWGKYEEEEKLSTNIS